MLFTSPYEARLVAEERTKDGIRRIQRNRYIKAMQQGRDATSDKLLEPGLSLLTAQVSKVTSSHRTGMRNAR